MKLSLFITFEGLDGSGKSTYLRQSAAWLHSLGVEFHTTREPGGCSTAEALRSLLLDPRWGRIREVDGKWGPRDGMVELLLMFAARRQHLVETIDYWLGEGYHVLCDRFTDSSFAYQGYGRGLPLSTIEQVDKLVTGRRRPDFTFWFDLPPQEAIRRSSRSTQFDVESLDFHERVADGYQRLMEYDRPERWVRFSTYPETEEQVLAAVKERLALILGIEGR